MLNKKRTIEQSLKIYFTLILILLLSMFFLLLTSLEVQASNQVPPKTVMYVEVNDNEFSNIGKYTLEGTNKPTIDIGIIFAANINYNQITKQPYLFLNEQVKHTLDENDTQIKPLQARGTKVLLSILGNHEGVGFANFPDYASADNFAAELEQVVITYDLDGIDFDDEYAEYGKNETGQPNNQSFIWLIQALRSRLGNEKIITLYDIGPAADKSRGNEQVSKNIDYAWNPYYGTWRVPNFAGMDATRLSPAAVEVGINTEQSVQLAKKTKFENYGIFMMYNLGGNNSADFLTGISKELYGRETIYLED